MGVVSLNHSLVTLHLSCRFSCTPFLGQSLLDRTVGPAHFTSFLISRVTVGSHHHVYLLLLESNGRCRLLYNQDNKDRAGGQVKARKRGRETGVGSRHCLVARAWMEVVVAAATEQSSCGLASSFLLCSGTESLSPWV